MSRRIAEIDIPAQRVAALKEQMLSWSSRLSISLFLDSNGYPDPHGHYECLLGAGARHLLIDDDAGAFHQLQALHDAGKDWLFGHICYDLKNVLQPRLSSRHPRRHGYRQLQFFVPEVVVLLPRDSQKLRVECLSGDPRAIAAEILQEDPAFQPASIQPLSFMLRLQREEYIGRIARLKEHIRNGDCYEITCCNEAYSEGASINPRAVFRTLNARSPAPFAAFYQDERRFMMCASPERFLQRTGRVVRSQPIKGTARRGRDAAEDEGLRMALSGSEKEQAENVMIADLVRNDLAISCVPGSIRADELFGIYTFPQVHQMISTISGTLRPGMPVTQAIQAAFPMGSMTGAPKHRVMQLIDRYEAARRELFSGTVGYISPQGDFDLNVIIRSLFYESESRYLSYQTGGAITWGSDPAGEWEEIRLKAAAMEQVFA